MNDFVGLRKCDHCGRPIAGNEYHQCPTPSPGETMTNLDVITLAEKTVGKLYTGKLFTGEDVERACIAVRDEMTKRNAEEVREMCWKYFRRGSSRGWSLGMENVDWEDNFEEDFEMAYTTYLAQRKEKGE